jgi:hypothetical protein
MQRHFDFVHSDSAYFNSAHSDSAHSDFVHSDSAHSDSAHSDSVYSDSAHSDSAHSDSAHSDSRSSSSNSTDSSSNSTDSKNSNSNLIANFNDINRVISIDEKTHSIKSRLFTLHWLTILSSSTHQTHFLKLSLDWPQGWVSNMSNNPTRFKSRVEHDYLFDESSRVWSVVRRSNSIRIDCSKS